MSWPCSCGGAGGGGGDLAPDMGAARNFILLAGGNVSNEINEGETMVVGEVGAGGEVTGFPPGLIGGGYGIQDATAALAAALAVYGALNHPYDEDLSGQSLDGMTLAGSKTYRFAGAAVLPENGTLTLNGDGADVWIIQADSLSIGANAVVTFTTPFDDNRCRVFWRIAGPVVVGPGAAINGTIVALGDVDLQAGAQVLGRAFSINGGINTDTIGGSGLNCYS